MSKMMKRLKRSLAALLAVCMVVTSFNGVAWGATGDVTESDTTEAYYKLGSLSLLEEARRAINDGIRYNDAFDPRSLSFKNAGDSDAANAYSSLFNDKQGAFYELDLFAAMGSEDDEWLAQLPDGANLRIFVQADSTNVPEELLKTASDSDAETVEYVLNGKERLVFLYINSSDQDLEFSVQIGSKFLPSAKVLSKSSLLNVATKSNSDKAESPAGAAPNSSGTGQGGNTQNPQQEPTATETVTTESTAAESTAAGESTASTEESVESSTEAAETNDSIAESTGESESQPEEATVADETESSAESVETTTASETIGETEANITATEESTTAVDESKEETTEAETIAAETTEVETTEETTEAETEESSEPSFEEENTPVDPVITMSRNEIPRVGTPTAGEVDNSGFSSPDEEFEALYGDEYDEDGEEYPGNGSSFYTVEPEETDTTIKGTVYGAAIMEEEVGGFAKMISFFSLTSSQEPVVVGVEATTGDVKAGSDSGKKFTVDLYDYDGITSGGNIGEIGKDAYDSPINRALLDVKTVNKGNAKIKNHLAFGLSEWYGDNGFYNSYKSGAEENDGKNNIVQGIVKDFRTSDKRLQFSQRYGQNYDPVSGIDLFASESKPYNKETYPIWSYLDVDASNFFTETDNHYIYDSNVNGAALESGKNGYSLNATQLSSGGNTGNTGNFWPLDKYNNPNNNKHNYFFGMHMGFNFALSPDGKFNDEEMVFNFRGDDDVWVYLTKNGDESDPGKLVLDIGGIHDSMSGSINFATGEITYGPVGAVFNQDPNVLDFEWNKGEIRWYLYTPDIALEEYNAAHPYAPIKIEQIYEKYDKFIGLERGVWNEYTLDFYYLERGGYASNCKLDFVLPVLPENSVMVTKQVQGELKENINADTEYPMQLYVDGKMEKEFSLKANESISIPVSPNAKEFYVEEVDNKDATTTLWSVGSNKTSGEKSALGKVGTDKMVICTNVYDQLNPEVNKTAFLDETVQDKAVYDVTLSVTGDSVTVKTEQTEVQPADVLFVVDVSNSMLWGMNETVLDMKLNGGQEPDHPTNGSSRWDTLVGTRDNPGTLWKTVEKLIGDENTENRVGIICYAGMTRGNGDNARGIAKVAVPWTRKMADCVNLFFEKSLTDLNETNGGTNGQVGFVEALNQLEELDSTNQQKFVIYISDGLPTQYNQNNGLLKSDIRGQFYVTMEKGRDSLGLTTEEVQTLRDEFDKTFENKSYKYNGITRPWLKSDSERWKRLDESTKWTNDSVDAKYNEYPFLYMFKVCGKKTIEAALKLKKQYPETKIYTVGMSGTLASRPELVGYSLNPSGGNKYQEEYYSAGDAGKLLEVFEGLSQTIEGSVVYNPKNLYVTDQLTEKVDFLLNDKNMPTLSLDGRELTGSRSGDNVTYTLDGTEIATVNLTTKSISWNVADKLEKGVTKALSYQIYVNEKAAFKDDGTQYPDVPNKGTGTHAIKKEKGYYSNIDPTLSYYDEMTDGNKTKDFPHPVVRPLPEEKGTLTITKNLADLVKPVENATFTFNVELSGITASAVSKKIGSKETSVTPVNGSIQEQITIGIGETCEYVGLNKEVTYKVTEVLPENTNDYDVALTEITVSVAGGNPISVPITSKSVEGSMSTNMADGTSSLGFVTYSTITESATSWSDANLNNAIEWVQDPDANEAVLVGDGLWWRNEAGELKTWDSFTVDEYGPSVSVSLVSSGTQGYKGSDENTYQSIDAAKAMLENAGLGGDLVGNKVDEGKDESGNPTLTASFTKSATKNRGYWSIYLNNDRYTTNGYLPGNKSVYEMYKMLYDKGYSWDNKLNEIEKDSTVKYYKTLTLTPIITEQWAYTTPSGETEYLDGTLNDLKARIAKDYPNSQIITENDRALTFKPHTGTRTATAGEIIERGYEPVKYSSIGGTKPVAANVDLTFINKYTMAQKASLKVIKSVKGDTAPGSVEKAESYAFAVYKKDGQGVYQLFTDYMVGESTEPSVIEGFTEKGFYINDVYKDKDSFVTLNFTKRNEAGTFKIVELITGTAMDTRWDKKDLGNAAAEFVINGGTDALELTCTNTYWNQELTIQKQVEGVNPYENAFYHFTVNLTNINNMGTVKAKVTAGNVKLSTDEKAEVYENGQDLNIELNSGSFDLYLTNGTEVKLLNLPAGARYEVKETLDESNPYYTVALVNTLVDKVETKKVENPLTGTLDQSNKTDILTFVNSYTMKKVSLTLTKELVQVNGDGSTTPKADAEEVTFLFKITNKDELSPGYKDSFYRRLTIPAGDTELTIVITDLPASTNYEIVELEQMRYEAVNGDTKNVDTVSGPTVAVFENHRVSDERFSSTSVTTNKVKGNYEFEESKKMPQDELRVNAETIVAALPPKVKTSNFDSDGYDDGDTQLV